MAGKLAVMSSTSLRKDSQTASRVMDHFRGKTVGLLLWGDAFRPAKAHWEGGDVNCVLDSFEAQREATLSQRDKILRPLRRSGARVQVLFTFPLVWVVLSTATVESTKGNSFFGFAIGFAVFFLLAIAASLGKPRVDGWR